MTEKRISWQQRLVSVFGGVGYVTWALQLLLLVTFYFERFYHSKIGEVIFPVPSDTTLLAPEPVNAPAITLPTSGIFTVVMLLLGIIFIGIVLYTVIMRYIPTVNKTANSVVHETTEQALGQVERIGQKKLSPHKRRILTAQISWWLKIAISVMPLIIVLFVAGTPLISKEVAVVGMGSLSIWAVLCFSAQKTLAHVWRKTIKADHL